MRETKPQLAQHVNCDRVRVSLNRAGYGCLLRRSGINAGLFGRQGLGLPVSEYNLDPPGTGSSGPAAPHSKPYDPGECSDELAATIGPQSDQHTLIAARLAYTGPRK